MRQLSCTCTNNACVSYSYDCCFFPARCEAPTSAGLYITGIPEELQVLLFFFVFVFSVTAIVRAGNADLNSHSVEDVW